MSFIFNCPNCDQAIEAIDEWIGQEAPCPSCQKKLIIQKNTQIKLTPVYSSQNQSQPKGGTNTSFSPDNSAGLLVSPVGTGKFSIVGSYWAVWSCVQQTLQDCDCIIKESNPIEGKIVGKFKYGINPSGITVNAILYSNGNSIMLKFVAKLTGAFDTTGICAKKVNLLSERFLGLSSAYLIPAMPDGFPQLPPSFPQEAGESYADPAADVSGFEKVRALWILICSIVSFFILIKVFFNLLFDDF